MKILEKIEMEFAQQDTRGKYRAKLNGKILFRETDEESYKNRIKEINSFFEDANIVIEKETGLPYKIKSDKNLSIYIDFVLNKIYTGKEEYLINSNYLESPIGKAKYTSKSYSLEKEEFYEIPLTKNEQLKIKFLEKLQNIDNFEFTQDGYFKELVYAYKIMLNKLDNNKIQVTNTETMIIEDGTHRVIALSQLISSGKKLSNYSLETLKNKIKTFLINITITESKVLEGHFKFSNMEVLNYSEIDEKPENIEVLNIIEGHKELI